MRRTRLSYFGIQFLLNWWPLAKKELLCGSKDVTRIHSHLVLLLSVKMLCSDLVLSSYIISVTQFSWLLDMAINWQGTADVAVRTVISIWFLGNIVFLFQLRQAESGEALFLGANEPHAYMSYGVVLVLSHQISVLPYLWWFLGREQ